MKQEIKERVERIRKGEVPEGYRKTKVGIIPVEWDVKKLGDSCAKITDGTHDTPKPIEDGIPFITAIHVKDNNIDFENCLYLPNTVHQIIYRRCNPEKNDVLLVNIGAGVATTALVNVDYEFSLKNVALLKPDKKRLVGSYLNYYQLFNKYKITNILLNGGAQPFLSLKQISDIPIALPTLTEQQKIAEILSTWDKAIELKEKLIEEKKEFKRGLMQNLLTGKLRFPEFNDEWVAIPLQNVVKKITSKNKENNKTIITISAKEGFVNQDEYFSKLVASKDLSGYFLIKKGDFAYNKSYSNGYPVGAIKRLDSFENAVVTTLYICFRIKDEKVLSDFLKYYFDSGLLNRQIKRIANEGGRAHGLLNVTPNDFFNINVNLPEYEEQEKISEILLANDQDIQLLEKELFEFKEQKRGLMQLLLTGIVRVEVN